MRPKVFNNFVVSSLKFVKRSPDLVNNRRPICKIYGIWDMNYFNATWYVTLQFIFDWMTYIMDLNKIYMILTWYKTSATFVITKMANSWNSEWPSCTRSQIMSQIMAGSTSREKICISWDLNVIAFKLINEPDYLI